MLLIADSGSTKTDWCLTDASGASQKLYHTVGYNPYFIDSESIYQNLTETLVNELDISIVETVYFYGAGCSTPEKKESVRRALARTFPKAEVYVDHDLLASARALLGRKAGFAAILGTGTNTCLYDGQNITLNIDSLGYLLGDEGSGSYIGKKFVRDFMRNQLDESLREKFMTRFQITSNDQIYQTLYTTQFPNRYLAGFCKFAEESPSHPYIRSKVRDAFRDFFKNLVTRYPDYKRYEFNCCGSVGFTFRDLLEEVAAGYGMHLGKIIKSPLEDLVQFHLTALG